MRIHVVAVAGTGMGSLAGLLKELGHDVSGSDVAFDPPMGPALESWGIACRSGFDARNLEPPPDLVVIGNVCRRENPEARAAIDGGLEYTHIAGALKRFVLAETSPLVVAGTHGKTTTTALAAWLLDATGFEPGFFVGGIPKNFERSFRAPSRVRRLTSPPRARRTPFVIEGDEYDTAFFEKTAKFLHYGPEVAIVTSIEHDHVDIYPDLESYVAAFDRFVAEVPESGLVVAYAGDPGVVEVVQRSAKAPVAWYALEGDPIDVPPHWVAAPAGTDDLGTRFDLYAGGVACGRYRLPLSGRHNLKNAVGAIGAVVQGYGAGVDALGAALDRFEGVKRRQEILGTPRGIVVYDDFAHHPSAVRETLDGLRARHRGATVHAVFEPRSATACRAMHQQAYAESFEGADDVVIAPLGRDLPEDQRLSTERLAEDLRARGKRAAPYGSVDAIITHLVSTVESGDVIALLSNGAFGGIHAKLVAALERGDRSAEGGTT